MTILGLSRRPKRAIEFPSVDREDVEHVFKVRHGLPHVNWDLARVWIDRRASDQRDDDWYRRAIAAAWLDELRDTLELDHRRWRRPGVEGLGPLEGWAAKEACEWADKSLETLRHTLTPVRGAAAIPPVALICFGRHDDYYAFLARYLGDGNHPASPAVYLRELEGAFPIVAIQAEGQGPMLVGAVAHELTHHALRESNLPLCVEEGYTQMMEERVTGVNNFSLDREMIGRHRALWSVIGLEPFLSGEGFHSTDDDHQELAYHLAQWLVRSQLQERPQAFFAFSRACRDQGPEMATHEHLGESLKDLAARTVGIDA